MKAPLFSLKDGQTGNILRLEDVKGQVVMLTFWASWCPDSQRDLEQKWELYKQMDKAKLAFLTINVTGREGRSDDGIAYAKEHGYDFTILLDEGTTVYDQYRCMGVPTTFLLDEELNIKYRYSDRAAFMEIMQGLSTLL
ncbi:TlpA disulfide reductase family protein [Halalkalibacterium halodurans]|uniref:TlpA disulfide reductase family protein n=1 Tax=Halalkalibacterium halodurans TaxID=86665 RepID=UPI0010FE0EF5|nr:TlpA disulfide reductase family protein [Halalkalibacterium halodurans]MED4123918.1 TlpA disulfide reductase family protein [Halalkalibacterium halodurans]